MKTQEKQGNTGQAKKIRVLIVDDSLSIQKYLDRALSESGFDVCGIANNGMESVEMARILKPDIVLMDIVMPGDIDGIDAAKRIREQLDIPVIFVTGFSDEGIIRRAACAEPYGYIVKPYQVEEIKANILIAVKKKAAERLIRLGQARFRQITQSISVVFWMVTADYGQVLYVSPAYEKLTGYPCEGLFRNPLSFLDIVHPEDKGSVTKAMQKHQDGEVTEIISRVIHADGSLRWVHTRSFPVINENDEVIQIVGITEDITRRIQAEEGLRNSENRFSQAFHHVPSMMTISTIEEGLYLDVNQKYLEVTGYSREEVVGKTSTEIDFISPGDRDRIKRQIIDCGIVEGMELKLRKKSGDQIICLYNGVIIPIDEKQCLLSLAENITERKRLESQLLQSQKMEAIGTLAGGIAHDFNNILAAMIGFTEMAMEEPDDAQRREYLDKVMISSDRAKNLVDQIISFSQKSGLEKKPLDIGTLVRKFVKLLRSTTPTTIEIKQHISSESLVALANSTQIHQVMMNLCANATHAMKDKGGALAIRLSSTDITSDSPLVSLDLTPGPHLKLEVRDTGYGIDPADMGRIFDPFFTTKGVSEGTGLGLSVVYGIVKSHGGAVTVDSEVGSGSTFTVYLPALQQHAEGEEVETEVGEMPHGRHERILFVDDEAGIVEIGRGILKKLGYVVLDFTDSVQACEAFRRSPYAYDLVITDMTMPHLTGIELSREILKIRPEMPTILCTGYSDIISEEKAMQEGVRRFIMKPLRRRELAKAVREVLDEERITS